MNPLEAKYNKENVRQTLAARRRMEFYMKQASKDLAKRVKQFTLHHPDYVGNFYAWNKGLEKQIKGVMKTLHGTVQADIEAAMISQWSLGNAKNNEFVDRFLKDIPVSKQITQSFYQTNPAAMMAFIERVEAGATLSSRIWGITDGLQSDMGTFLGSGITTGKGSVQIAKQIEGFIKGKGILYKGKLIKGAGARDWQAIRLAVTETNMAYRKADFIRRQQLPFVKGIRVHLSGMHPRQDICDSLEGNYPKEFMFSGWHPICICYSTSIMAKGKELVQSIKTGKPPAGTIRTIPPKAGRFLQANKEAILKSHAYWLDNFGKDLSLKKSIFQVPGIPKAAAVPVEKLFIGMDNWTGMTDKGRILLMNKEFSAGLPRGYSVRTISMYQDGMFFGGEIMSRNKVVGNYTRSIIGTTIDRFNFNLRPQVRGKGLGSKFINVEESFYKRLGITDAKMIVIDDGRFVWPHMGYEFENEIVRKRVLKRINSAYRTYQEELGIKKIKVFLHEREFINDINFWNKTAIEYDEELFKRF